MSYTLNSLKRVIREDVGEYCTGILDSSSHVGISRDTWAHMEIHRGISVFRAALTMWNRNLGAIPRRV